MIETGRVPGVPRSLVIKHLPGRTKSEDDNRYSRTRAPKALRAGDNDIDAGHVAAKLQHDE